MDGYDPSEGSDIQFIEKKRADEVLFSFGLSQSRVQEAQVLLFEFNWYRIY